MDRVAEVPELACRGCCSEQSEHGGYIPSQPAHEVNMTVKCDWPGCWAQSEHPVADGWAGYAGSEGLLEGLPGQGMLCPRHKQRYEEFVVRQPPPTTH